MKKSVIVLVVLIAMMACGTKSENASQKQSEEELRSAIVGSWYVVTGENRSITVDSTEIAQANQSEFKGLGMTMRREFYKDGRYFEREITKVTAYEDTAGLLLYSIKGTWEISGDTLILTSRVEDVVHPEHTRITAKSGAIRAKEIIKRISNDSLIIQDNVKDKNGVVQDLIMLKE
jgi:hypothetical protein